MAWHVEMEIEVDGQPQSEDEPDLDGMAQQVQSLLNLRIFKTRWTLAQSRT